jgi:regulator of protease activity HflC (stomatin/prohibitin superfamily)
MIEFSLSLFALVCIVVIVTALRMQTVIVHEHEAALHFRHGKRVGALPAGRHRIFGSGHEVQRFDLRRSDFQVSGQEFLTADKAAVKVSAVVEYQITDALRFISASANPIGSLYHSAQIALREVIGGHPLEAVIDRGTDLSSSLLASVRPHAESLGLAVVGMQVKDIAIGAELRRVFTEALVARQQSLVVLEKARAEAAAIRTLANAARVFETHPALLQLKFLQAIENADGGIAQPLALGTAGHWLDFLKK